MLSFIYEAESNLRPCFDLEALIKKNTNPLIFLKGLEFSINDSISICASIMLA